MDSIQRQTEDKLRDGAEQIAKDKGLAPDQDPFYSRKNQKILKASISQLNAGAVVSKSLDELQNDLLLAKRNIS